MEPLFINSYAKNKETMEEFYKNYFLKSKRNLVLYTVAILLLVSDIVLSIIKKQIFNLPVFIIVPVFFLLCYYIYSKAVALSVKGGGGRGEHAHITVTVTDEGINYSSPAGVTPVAWEDMVRATQTANLFLLLTKEKRTYILRKDSFTAGTADGFYTLLKSKSLIK